MHYSPRGSGRNTKETDMLRLTLVLLSLVQTLQAETVKSRPATPLRTKQVVSNSQQGPIGILDLRPTFTFSNSSWEGQNMIELGYKHNKRFSISYQQQFRNQMTSGSSNQDFLNLSDGFVRTKFNEMFKAPTYGLTFNYENRVYTPTDELKRSRGFNTAIRNYFTFLKKLSPYASFRVSEVPILHWYNASGSGNDANPLFENRVILGPDFQLGKFTLSVPVFVSFTTFRNYQPGATNNAAWTSAIWLSPELSYALHENVSIGINYESGNLIQSDYKGWADPNGFGQGTFSGVLTLSL